MPWAFLLGIFRMGGPHAEPSGRFLATLKIEDDLQDGPQAQTP
jgi:hypothetical protein